MTLRNQYLQARLENWLVLTESHDGQPRNISGDL